MSKRLRPHQTKGFTLIELLVVIAIIGILAALLFPAISGALGRARAVRAGNIARQIHMAITGVSMDREAVGRSHVWPKEDPDPERGEGEYTTSTGWLDHIVEMEYIEAGVPRDQFDYRFFAVHGVTVQRRYDLWDSESNPWIVVSDLQRGTMPDSMPFIMTRNIGTAGHDDDTGDGFDDTADLPGLADIAPFAEQQAVILTKGGSVRILPGELFNEDHPAYDEEELMDNFNPSERSRTILRN